MLAFAALCAPALAAYETVLTQTGNVFAPVNVSMPAGGTLDYDNEEHAPHNLISRIAGPDGGPLFQAKTFLGPGKTKPVLGVQYLSPGVYDFHCTLHNKMTGALTVTNGTPLERPKIAVVIKSSKLNDVRSSGVLKTKVTNSGSDGEVDLVAALGEKTLAHQGRIDVAGGDSENVSLKLNKGGTKALKGLSKANVKLTGAVNFGKPDSAKTTLK